jgi:hypothetical protein
MFDREMPIVQEKLLENLGSRIGGDQTNITARQYNDPSLSVGEESPYKIQKPE